MEIEVDGGIEAETTPVVRCGAGRSVSVAGTAVFRHPEGHSRPALHALAQGRQAPDAA